MEYIYERNTRLENLKLISVVLTISYKSFLKSIIKKLRNF